MIDHINLYVTELGRAKEFYTKALQPIGYAVLMEDNEYCGIGPAHGIEKWIGTIWLSEKTSVEPQHIAFRVPRRKLVDQFYKDALNAGRVDNGKPGIREHYHENYYAAFVLDPDGHNIEVVSHE